MRKFGKQLKQTMKRIHKRQATWSRIEKKKCKLYIILARQAIFLFCKLAITNDKTTRLFKFLKSSNNYFIVHYFLKDILPWPDKDRNKGWLSIETTWSKGVIIRNRLITKYKTARLSKIPFGFVFLHLSSVQNGCLTNRR